MDIMTLNTPDWQRLTWHVPLEQADEAAQRAPVRDLVLMFRPDGHEPHDEAGLLLDLLPAMQPARHSWEKVVSTQGFWRALAVP